MLNFRVLLIVGKLLKHRIHCSTHSNDQRLENKVHIRINEPSICFFFLEMDSWPSWIPKLTPYDPTLTWPTLGIENGPRLAWCALSVVRAFMYGCNLAECIQNLVNWCPRTSMHKELTTLWHCWLFLRKHFVGNTYDTRWMTIDIWLSYSSLLTRKSCIRSVTFFVYFTLKYLYNL